MSDEQRCDRCGKPAWHRISDGASEMCPRCFEAEGKRTDVAVPMAFSVEGFDSPDVLDADR